jgi:heme exporter protein A
VAALDRLDLRVERGEALALFGPNGAGKTTLIRILTQGLRPSSGTVLVDGVVSRADAIELRQRIGLISHQSLLYDQLTAAENLEFFAKLYGVDEPKARALELLNWTGLAHRAEDPVGTLSRGMRQRVSIARALVHDPPLVFLDEPFTGLDPHAADLLRSALDGLRERGHTILLVTHDLAQGLRLTDRWVLLSRGRLVASGASAEADPAGLVDQLRSVAKRRPAATA